MYHHLLLRHRDAVAQFIQFLTLHSREMSLDPRLYHSLGPGPGLGSQSCASTSGMSSVTGITTPSAYSTTASSAALRSTASSPSLRARQGVAVSARGDGIASPSPAGNVRVVVRVRNFLPRGGLLREDERSSPHAPRLMANGVQNSRAMPRV